MTGDSSVGRSPDYRDVRRLRDIDEALRVVEQHLRRGPLDDLLVYDAVRVRLMEVGEAVKGLSPDVTGSRPDIPWRDIARTRDHLVHRYFATSVEIIAGMVSEGVPPLRTAVTALLAEQHDPPTAAGDDPQHGPITGGV